LGFPGGPVEADGFKATSKQILHIDSSPLLGGNELTFVPALASVSAVTVDGLVDTTAAVVAVVVLTS
jgi:hypothetical protein